MVIDSGEGGTQTSKLMEVCRMRNTPIITFINKLDRDGLEPLELLADIEDKLQIECAPLLGPLVWARDSRGCTIYCAGRSPRLPQVALPGLKTV